MRKFVARCLFFYSLFVFRLVVRRSFVVCLPFVCLFVCCFLSVVCCSLFAVCRLLPALPGSGGIEISTQELLRAVDVFFLSGS